MKRIFSIGIALYYLLGTLGLDVNVHYCAGQIATISISSDAHACCCGDAAKKLGCCGDNSFSLKVDTQPVLLTSNLIWSSPAELPVSMILPVVIAEHTTDVNEALVSTHLVPPQPLWLVYQQVQLYS